MTFWWKTGSRKWAVWCWVWVGSDRPCQRSGGWWSPGSSCWSAHVNCWPRGASAAWSGRRPRPRRAWWRTRRPGCSWCPEGSGIAFNHFRNTYTHHSAQHAERLRSWKRPIWTEFNHWLNDGLWPDVKVEVIKHQKMTFPENDLSCCPIFVPTQTICSFFGIQWWWIKAHLVVTWKNKVETKLRKNNIWQH